MEKKKSKWLLISTKNQSNLCRAHRSTTADEMNMSADPVHRLINWISFSNGLCAQRDRDVDRTDLTPRPEQFPQSTNSKVQIARRLVEHQGPT